MSIKADPKEAIGMSSWWLLQVANQISMYAWVEDHFADPRVQSVIDYKGDRSTDSRTDYYELVEKVREAAGGSYIDSSSLHHESVGKLSEFILLKGEQQKAQRAAIKREKIAALQKEIAELESQPRPSVPEDRK